MSKAEVGSYVSAHAVPHYTKAVGNMEGKSDLQEHAISQLMQRLMRGPVDRFRQAGGTIEVLPFVAA